MREPNDEIELEVVGPEPLWFRLFVCAAGAAWLFLVGIIAGALVSP